MTDATTAGSLSNEPTGQTEAPPSRAVTVLRTLGWILFTLFCLFTFTLLKLPDERIRNYVQGSINAALAPKGISLTANQGYVSVGFGLSYVMKEVTINLPPPDSPAHVDKVIVAPSLLKLLIGRLGGKAWVYSGDGKMIASFSTNKAFTSTALSFEAKDMDLGKIGLLPVLAGIHGSAHLTGDVSVDGDFSVPSTLNGSVRLDLTKIILDQQSIQGFQVPRLSISEGKIDLDLDKAKATIKTFQLGKNGNAADDIHATISGDMTLGKQWESSNLNAKASFSVSENVKKAFVLLDALLGAAKQPDGSYAYSLSGPISAINPTPLGGPGGH